jgi:hypothetical protein
MPRVWSVVSDTDWAFSEQLLNGNLGDSKG